MVCCYLVCACICILYYTACLFLRVELTCFSGHKGTFKWFDYLKQTKSVAAPVKLFDKVSTYIVCLNLLVRTN